ncbi:MAG: MFS transporter [Deltaproteobacteria bacterium]|nr:MFS transporter [Deltaproteobacteria bacterium]
MSEKNRSMEDTKVTSPLREIVQPFIDLVHAPRALWGVNLAYTLEGLSYFGILTYLAMYFSDYVFQGIKHADVWSHNMVMILTAGIAISMVLLGFVPDKIGVRRALILSFFLLFVGRFFISGSHSLFGFEPSGLWSPLHLTIMFGIIIILIGYGMYQPAAYAAVRQFTTPKTASMGYAMLYALMNAGSSLVMLSFLLRDEKFLGLGIEGTFWVYTGITLVSLLSTHLILSKKTVEETIKRVKEETEKIEGEKSQDVEIKTEKTDTQLSAEKSYTNERLYIPITFWIIVIGLIATAMYKIPHPIDYIVSAIILLTPFILLILPQKIRRPTMKWIMEHPLANTRFFVFIFSLIPVQTLFTYNWLILPQYISRAYEGWVGEYFEVASNLNPILIFILVPIITAATVKVKVYNMMIWGTLVMSLSAFILAIDHTPLTLGLYILVMTIGEAMWSPRFLQYATEIAPEGKAGLYQGVAQLPWFLTKFLVPLLYSGWMLERYCPQNACTNPERMWFIFGLIAIISPAILIIGKNWLSKDVKVATPV